MKKMSCDYVKAYDHHAGIIYCNNDAEYFYLYITSQDVRKCCENHKVYDFKLVPEMKEITIEQYNKYLLLL